MTFKGQHRWVTAGLLSLGLITSGCGKDKPSVEPAGDGSKDESTNGLAGWKVESGECPPEDSSRIVKECARIAIDAKKFRTTDTKEMTLALPDGTTLKVSPDETGNFGRNGIVWHGFIPGKPYSDVTISTVGNAVVGTIAVDNRMFRIRTLPDGSVVLEELDPEVFLNDAPTGAGPADRSEAEAPSLGCTAGTAGCEPVASQCTHDAPARIDLLVLYTQRALTWLKGIDALHAWTYLQVFQTNRSFRLSNLTHSIRLVSVNPVAYDETSNDASSEALIMGYLSNAHDLRNEYNADVVVLLTQAPSAGGAGYAPTFTEGNIPDDAYTPFESQAFAVVDALGFETTDFTFSHELGHLMGAEHDEFTPSTTQGAIRDQSHGYMDETTVGECKPFMTIMAQRSPAIGNEPARCPQCDRHAMWSNTDDSTKHCGRYVGSATAKNRDSLALTAQFIPKFRCGRPSPGTAWMKDTWNDNGAEPDPDQVNSDMWKSPYIWVRNSKDAEPAYAAQHIHEDPIPGQQNFVYVKLQNDGVQTSGKLEVWWAEMATALVWPANFNPVGPATQLQLAADSPSIVPVPWTPSGNGPFSLVAKWVSASDPIPAPEPVDLDSLARSNNNVIWRNMNVVTLGPGTLEASEVLAVRNPSDQGAFSDIVLKPSDANPLHSFLRNGEVIVRLDRELMSAWERTGYQGRGFERSGRSLRITDPSGAILQGLGLGPGVEGRMQIVFRLGREGLKNGKYSFDVVQNYTGRRTRQMGGANYEIQVTTKR